MKVPNKKILSLLLACLMAFNLTACGSSNADTNAGEAPSARDTTKTNASAQAENTSVEMKPYQSEFIHIMSDSKTSLTPLAFTKDGIYAMGEDVLGRRAPDDVADTYFGQYDIREPRIFYVSYTGETTKLPGYTPAPVPAVPENVYNLTTSTHIMGLAINSNGNLITFESSYANWTDIQIVDTDDPDYYTHYFYDTDYYIRELQPDGGEISCTVVECGGNDFLYSSCTTDQDGNILVRRETGLGEYALLGVSPKGEIIYEIESQDTISTTFTMEDGSLYASIWGYEMLMVPIDIENKTLGEGTTLPSNAYSVFSGGGDYPLYYTSGVWFYGFDPKTGASDKLFSWLDLDITPEYLTAIGVSEDGTIRTITSDFYNDTASYSVDIACIRKNTDTAPAEKSELTLATLNLSFDLRNAVIRFNRHNDKVHITVKDYSEYNTEDDFTAGMMKLTTEIIAGNSPDIIDLNGVSRAQFESKGFLEDLAPYLDADASISLDIATLQVLEEYIAGFKGCVIAVSHDRCFMDRVAGHLFIFEGDGKITDFPLSYSDWLEWKDLKAAEEKSAAQATERTASARPRNSERADAGKKLSYKEKREMGQIEAELENLEAEKSQIEADLNSGTLDYAALQAESARVGEIISRIDEITLRWLELSEKC